MSATMNSNPRWALAGLSVSMLMASLNTSIANAALPTIAESLNASFQQVQWIVLAYLLAITTVIVSVGRLGDILGRRRLLLFGLFMFTAASLLCGSTWSFWLLVAARAVQGIGAAIMMALALGLVTETLPQERTGRGMGILGSLSAVGTALGPMLGGVLIAAAGWHAIFLVNVPLGLLALALTYRYLPLDRQRQNAPPVRFDFVGTVVLALTLAAYALAMTVGRGKLGPLNLGLIVASVLGAVLFLIIQSRTESPLVNLAIFRRAPLLTGGLVTSMLVSTVMMATLVVGPFYLSRALELNAALVGMLLSVGPFVAALTGVPAGHMADRFGGTRMSVLGLGAMAIGSVLVALTSGVAGYICSIAVVTAGYALFQTANNAVVMSSNSCAGVGLISGVLNLSRNLGLITGASVMGAVFAFAAGAADIGAARPESVAAGMRITFSVAFVLILVALGVAFLSRLPKLSRLHNDAFPAPC